MNNQSILDQPELMNLVEGSAGDYIAGSEQKVLETAANLAD